jgi:hypothetical protein
MTRHEQEQAIGKDLEAISVALFFAKGSAARRPLIAHKNACMAQIRAWNREDQILGMTDDELLAELMA